MGGSNNQDDLFCRYSYDLQRDARLPLESTNHCGDCGAIFEIEAGRAWRITREVCKERISTADYDEEIVEDRTYLVSNRFIIKCHRPNGQYACALCFRFRDKDTLCDSPRTLIRHVQVKHTADEYLDADIKEVGQSIDIEKTTTHSPPRSRHDSKASIYS